MTITGRQLFSYWSIFMLGSMIMGIVLDGLGVPGPTSWLACSLSLSLWEGLCLVLLFSHYRGVVAERVHLVNKVRSLRR